MKAVVPVNIRYFTAGVQNGELIFFNDVYGYDDRLITKLNAKDEIL